MRGSGTLLDRFGRVGHGGGSGGGIGERIMMRVRIVIIQREKDEKRGRVGGCGGEQCTGGMMGQREGGRGLGFIGRAARVAIAKEEGTSSVGDHLQI